MRLVSTSQECETNNKKKIDWNYNHFKVTLIFTAPPSHYDAVWRDAILVIEQIKKMPSCNSKVF